MSIQPEDRQPKHRQHKDSQHAVPTPPDIFIDPSLTPPPTDEETISPASRILEEIKQRREGRSRTNIPWAVYSLDLKGYQELLHHLEQDESLYGFALHKLRYDYFPYKSQLVLRMPSYLHDTFIMKIVTEIESQLKSIQGASAEFAKEIWPGGSSTIRFADEKYSRHDPDGQFQHPKAQYPGVVIEVSYTQKRKDLGRLAEEYILGSNSDIRVVVGLDIEYKADKKATLSVWRPKVVTNEVGEKELVAQLVVANQVCRDARDYVLSDLIQVFRNSNGKPNVSQTGGLRLRLRDFATSALTGGDFRDPIILSSTLLCSLLDRVEARASVVEQHTGIVTTDKPWVRKRRRDSSSPEELTQGDEKRIRAVENRITTQATEDDSSYKTGSTSEGET